jgi:hypothetical protein
MKHKLLFVTYNDNHEDEGFSYVIELARTLNKDLTVFLIWKRRLTKKLEDVMAAATFAEADEHETARQMATGEQEEITGEQEEINGNVDPKLEPFIGKCHESGINVDIRSFKQDVFPTITNYFKRRNGVDIVLLGPNVAGSGSISARELKRLANTISRPIVTIAR